jgi:hypothetical protein
MFPLPIALGGSRVNLKRKLRLRRACPAVEQMECRTLLSAAIAPVGSAANLTAGATDLGAFGSRTGHTVKGAVGVHSSDAVYKLEVSAEINLSLTLQNLLQKDQVYLLYADGTRVNTGWQNSAPVLKISQHLDPGTYYVDIEHGFVADNTTGVGAATGAANVHVTTVKQYHIKSTDGYVLVAKGTKPDDTIPPQETIAPTAFSAAFGATGAATEPTISPALAQASGFVQYQAFTAAQGYQLWGAGGPSPDDEIQQALGDCYFMSIISSIARDDPGLIENSIVPQANGNFLVKFQNNGQEMDEQVDDMLPVNGSGQTVFAGIASDKAIWPAILEKAWCDFRPNSTAPGSYDGIQAGFPSESLKAFGSTDAVEDQSNTYNTAPQLLTAISSELRAGDLVDADTIQPQNWPSSDPALPSGLFTGHAYSVVSADVASNSIQLRNPWATNTQGVGNDGSGGYITITGDQLVQSIDLVSHGTLAAVTPNPNPNPNPNPTPTPTPTTATTQILPENLGPNSFQTNGGSNYDFFSFTANSGTQADISINSVAFTPELLIAQQGSNGWTTVGSDTNTAGSTTADVKFTAVSGVIYGIGVFVSGAADTGAYTLVLKGDLSAPAQSTPAASTGSLSGVVYNDANADGTQDNGEAGLAGWTVFIDLNGTGQFATGDPTATTDPNGAYTFTGLQPGSYTVGVEPIAGYTQTSPAGAAGATVTVVAGQASTVSPFGEAKQNGGGISGSVYSDDNGDGAQEAGEAGLAGWYVYVDLGDTGQYVDGDPYVATDANGTYTFTGLPPGSYITRIYPESGYTTTQGSSGWINTVTATQNSVGGNFGETRPTGALTGVVYSDDNGDGVQDAGEAGLQGWQVYIDVGNTGSYASGDPTAYTDGSGTYTFGGLTAGSYVVRIVDQTGYTTEEGSRGWAATVVAGQSSNGGFFGESQATGGLSGTVYFDANRNGIQDRREYGILNWAVYIDLDDSGQYVTGDPYVLTDSYGGYSFTGLAPGTYIVRQYVYSGTRWIASEGSRGWSVTVLANQISFGGDFGEHF